MRELRKAWVLSAGVLAVAGCVDEGPVEPVETGAAEAVAYLSCQADLRTGDISCGGSEAGLEGGALGAIIGGQGVYVLLTSNGVAYDEGSEVFRADVTVKNLGNQVIGTADGATPHTDGIRIFFVEAPATTSGAGVVAVRNADGTGSFTGNDQPYFQYKQALAPGRTSLPKTWEWDVPSTVERFSFLVGVAAELADDDGFQPAGIDFIAQTLTTDTLHSCAIDYSGQAWCWGLAQYGRLGNGVMDSVYEASPVRVEQGDLKFVSIGSGLQSTCALTDTGEAYCWGFGRWGRLGTGDTLPSAVPAKVAGGYKFKQLAVGRMTNCGLTPEGRVYCWGVNSNQQIGDGTSDHAWEPVEGAGGMTFKSIAAGKFHFCGITFDYDTYCWGSNSSYKLGIGDVTGNYPEPQLVHGGHKFVQVFSGQWHTCALTEEGEAWCWGGGGNGRLGTGDNVTRTEPTKVLTSERFATMGVGTFHTCGVTYDGRGFCWGSNSNGKLGVGPTDPNNDNVNAIPLQVLNVYNWAYISPSATHTCGITTDGKLFCWGANISGRLGIGTTGGNFDSPQELMSMPRIALHEGGPLICGGEDGSGCFQRRSFDEQILLATTGGADFFVMNLGPRG